MTLDFRFIEPWVALFPGQGSQAIGMGRDFYDAGGPLREVFEETNEIAGKDIAKLCFRGPISKLSNTDNLQIAMTAMNLGVYAEFRAAGWPAPALALGHSVGEYSALAVAGVISRTAALQATLQRGLLMQREAKKFAGAMYAVKKSTSEAIEELITELAFGEHVIIGNDNGPGQQVISGAADAVRALVNRLMSGGVECVKLAVSGAWHSPLMNGCQAEFAECLAEITFNEPEIPVITNLTADFATEPERIRSDLARHLTGKVLWRDSMRRAVTSGYEKFVEIGSGRVLTRLAAKIAESEGRVIFATGIESSADLNSFGGVLVSEAQGVQA